jgi:hypothetical protein
MPQPKASPRFPGFQFIEILNAQKTAERKEGSVPFTEAGIEGLNYLI